MKFALKSSMIHEDSIEVAPLSLNWIDLYFDNCIFESSMLPMCSRLEWKYVQYWHLYRSLYYIRVILIKLVSFETIVFLLFVHFGNKVSNQWRSICPVPYITNDTPTWSLQQTASIQRKSALLVSGWKWLWVFREFRPLICREIETLYDLFPSDVSSKPYTISHFFHRRRQWCLNTVKDPRMNS